MDINVALTLQTAVLVSMLPLLFWENVDVDSYIENQIWIDITHNKTLISSTTWTMLLCPRPGHTRLQLVSII